MIATSLTATSTARLYGELAWLRSRYDEGVVASCVFAIIRQLETEIAWREHVRHHELAYEHEVTATAQRKETPPWAAKSTTPTEAAS